LRNHLSIALGTASFSVVTFVKTLGNRISILGHLEDRETLLTVLCAVIPYWVLALGEVVIKAAASGACWTAPLRHRRGS